MEKVRVIVISKAEPTGDQVIDDVKIVITGCPPSYQNLSEQAKYYENDAKDLAECLMGSLPGGTLDRLVVELLKHQVSLFRVLHTLPHLTTNAVDPAPPRDERGPNCGDRDCWQCNPPETPGN